MNIISGILRQQFINAKIQSCSNVSSNSRDQKVADEITDNQGRQFETCQLPYLFEYKSHACISRTSIFDLIKWHKNF